MIGSFLHRIQISEGKEKEFIQSFTPIISNLERLSLTFIKYKFSREITNLYCLFFFNTQLVRLISENAFLIILTAVKTAN